MRKIAFCLLATLCLPACTTLPTAHRSASQTASHDNSTVALQGRMSLRYMANGKEESVHGNFEWQQQGEHIAITLRSPVGQTLARIDVQNGLAELTQAGQAPRTARDVDSLINDTLGWPLPIAGLRYWLQGQAKSDDGSQFVANPDNTTVTTADGWRLRYVSWHLPSDSGASAPHATAVARPKRIDLTRTTAQAGEVELRLILDPPDT